MALFETTKGESRFGASSGDGSERRPLDEDDDSSASSGHLHDVALLGDHELPEIVDRRSFADFGSPAGGTAVSISVGGDPLNSSHEAPGGYDVCKEYGYKYEYTEEEDEDEEGGSGINGSSNDGRGGRGSSDEPDPLYGSGAAHVHAAPPSSSAGGGIIPSRVVPNWSKWRPRSGDGPSSSNDCRGDGSSSSDTPMSHDDDEDDATQFGGTHHLLGCPFHPVHDLHPRRDLESSLLWFTYRSGFPEIVPYGLRTDAGWGCTLRSAQMLMCHALRVHYEGRGWRPPRSFVKRRERGCFAREALTWFADFPSAYSAGGGGGTSRSASATTGGGTKNGESGHGGNSGEDGCWYSLHNMVAAGLARYDVLPGEWFGPGIACHVLKDLAALHARMEEEEDDEDDDEEEILVEETPGGPAGSVGEGRHEEKQRRQRQQQRDEEEDEEDAVTVRRPMLRVHVSQEGCVYRDAVEELMTRDGRKNLVSSGGGGGIGGGGGHRGGNQPMARSSDPSPPGGGGGRLTIKDPLLNPLGSASNHQGSSSPHPDAAASVSVDWDTSLLLLVPLRLGLRTFNAQSYGLPLAHTFALRQSVGFLGGTPRHALWFYGASEDGTKIFGLDPHTVQAAPEWRDGDGDGGGGGVVLSDDYLRSVHCTAPSTMDMSRIDPSLALAFYCRDGADFDDLCGAVSDMKAEGRRVGGIPELFGVADAAPDYCANVSSAMVEMMSSHVSGLDDGCDGDGGDGSDGEDEEYVML